MGRKEKLIKKLMSAPKVFTFEEAATLLGYFTYVQGNKGKTSGSRVVFSAQIIPQRSSCTNHIPEMNY